MPSGVWAATTLGKRQDPRGRFQDTILVNEQDMRRALVRAEHAQHAKAATDVDDAALADEGCVGAQDLARLGRGLLPDVEARDVLAALAQAVLEGDQLHPDATDGKGRPARRRACCRRGRIKADPYHGGGTRTPSGESTAARSSSTIRKCLSNRCCRGVLWYIWGMCRVDWGPARGAKPQSPPHRHRTDSTTANQAKLRDLELTTQMYQRRACRLRCVAAGFAMVRAPPLTLADAAASGPNHYLRMVARTTAANPLGLGIFGFSSLGHRERVGWGVAWERPEVRSCFWQGGGARPRGPPPKRDRKRRWSTSGRQDASCFLNTTCKIAMLSNDPRGRAPQLWSANPCSGRAPYKRRPLNHDEHPHRSRRSMPHRSRWHSAGSAWRRRLRTSHNKQQRWCVSPSHSLCGQISRLTTPHRALEHCLQV